MGQLEYVRDLDRRKLYREVARQHNLLISEVEKIVETQFEFLSDVIRKGELEAVRLPKLGLFHVKAGRIRHIEQMRKR